MLRIQGEDGITALAQNAAAVKSKLIKLRGPLGVQFFKTGHLTLGLEAGGVGDSLKMPAVSLQSIPNAEAAHCHTSHKKTMPLEWK